MPGNLLTVTQNAQSTATYWANGVLQNLTASTGYATNYNVDGEGRVYSAKPNGNQLASTVYNSASEPTTVTFASLDSDSFTYDPNTFRMTQYKYNVNGQSVVGTLNWNANRTLGSLNITDPFNAANTQNCSYSYDDLARLASGNCGPVWSQRRRSAITRSVISARPARCSSSRGITESTRRLPPAPE